MAPHQNRFKVGNVASTKSSSICLLVACLLSSGHLVACWNLRDNNYQGNDAYLGRNTAGYGGYRSEEQQSVSVHGGNSGGFERGSQLGASFQGQTAGGNHREISCVTSSVQSMRFLDQEQLQIYSVISGQTEQVLVLLLPASLEEILSS
uniref:Putative secreted protein n=1 Tax=Anopheles darlingi TaxID=43151 RepID=A0A2M4DP81_ANODA